MSDAKTYDNSLESEVDFLRYFYDEVGYALGPADDDVYNMIKEEYKKKNNILPCCYFNEDENL